MCAGVAEVTDRCDRLPGTMLLITIESGSPGRRRGPAMRPLSHSFRQHGSIDDSILRLTPQRALDAWRTGRRFRRCTNRAARRRLLAFGAAVVLGTGTPPAQRAASALAAISSESAAETALRQAEQAFQDGRLDEALSRCHAAIELNPNSAHAYYLLGGIQAERGDQEEARKALHHSLQLDPSRVATHVFLAKLYFQSKDFAAAAQQFEAATKLGDSTGVASYGLGLVLLAQSRDNEALPHLKSAVRANPNDPDWLLTLLVAQLKLRQLDEAGQSLARLEKFSHSDPWLPYRLGKLLREHGMNEQANAHFDRALKNLARMEATAPPPDVNLPDFYLQIAQLEFKQRDYAAVLASLAKLHAGTLESRREAVLRYLRGASLLGLGKVEQSRDDLGRAAQADPSEPEYTVRSIWAALLSGDREDAQGQAEIAARKWPDLPLLQHILPVISRERVPERARVPYLLPWHVKGEGLVCCPCKVPCPCRSNAPPTYNHCENVGVFRIARGHYGDLSLDGFTFAIISNDMGREDIPATLYVGQAASDSQVIALERLAQSFNLLRPSLFVNVNRVPMALTTEGAVYAVNIPKLLKIKIRRRLDARGGPLMATAALDYFSNEIEYAENLVYRLWDQDGTLRWDYSGHQANYRRFDLDSTAYLNRTMLIQFADFTGSFNSQELELIKKQKLPLLRRYPRSEDAAR
jgi:tetratricopeptide (TPR) repeat protein